MTANLKLTKFIDEQRILSRVKEMGAEITDVLGSEDLMAVCVLNGSFIFYSDLIRNIDADVTSEFLGCASYGDAMKSSGEVKMTLDLTNTIRDKNVLLIEDIIDTGLTMDFIAKSLKIREPKRLMVATLLFKPNALKTDFKPDFVGFEISNEFVVGYGLDYQGYYRNLPYIAQVNNIN